MSCAFGPVALPHFFWNVVVVNLWHAYIKNYSSCRCLLLFAVVCCCLPLFELFAVVCCCLSCLLLFAVVLVVCCCLSCLLLIAVVCRCLSCLLLFALFELFAVI